MTMVRSSCARSGIAFAIALMTAVIAGTSGSAHRRDEYLQAARIEIETGRVALELALTPGIALGDAIIADLDFDGDGLLSREEQRAYAARVMNAVELELDGRRLQMQPLASTFPDLEAIRRGEGTIRLQANAVVPPRPAGRHQLVFRNTHRQDVSVYLANAVMPSDDHLIVTGQRRDRDQRELTIDYVVRGGTPTSIPVWLLTGIAGAALVTRLLTYRSRAA